MVLYKQSTVGIGAELIVNTRLKMSKIKGGNGHGSIFNTEYLKSCRQQNSSAMERCCYTQFLR